MAEPNTGVKPGANTDDAASDKTTDNQKAGGSGKPKADDKNAGGGNGDGGGNDEGAKTLSMTQDELDEMIETRLAKAKKSWAKSATKAPETDNKADDKESGEVAKLRLENQLLKATGNLKDALEIAGAKNPAKLARLYADDLEFDDGGKIINLKTIVKEAKTDWADMFEGVVEGSGDGGKGNDKNSKPEDMNSFLRKGFGRK